MGDVVSLLFVLVAAAALIASGLIMVPVWRSGRNRKWLYMYLTFSAIYWVLILERLFTLVGVPLAWQIGVEGVLLALAVASLVLLYRHRRDPDAPDPEVP
jgi:hypothetical protein